MSKKAERGRKRGRGEDHSAVGESSLKSPREEGRYGPVHFCNAAREGDLKSLMLLLESDPDLINIKRRDGTTPLFVAASRSQEDAVRFLLENGARINLTDKDESYRDYYFSIAIKYDLEGVVRRLVKEQFSEEAPDNRVYDYLHAAVFCGNNSAVEFLLTRGDDFNQTTGDNNNYTPMHIAAEKSNVGLVDTLLGRGADINALAKNGRTPFYIAAGANRVKMMNFLIEKGANIHLSREGGFNALHVAAVKGCRESVRFLLKNKIFDVDEASKTHGRTAFHCAASFNQVEIMKFLMKEGADAALTETRRRRSALHLAASRGSIDAAKFLIQEGIIDIDQKSAGGATAFLVSIMSNQVRMMKFLKSKGADIEMTGEQGNRPLHIAVRTRNEEVVKFLVDNGASTKAETEKNKTALAIAIDKGDPEYATRILEIIAGDDKEKILPTLLNDPIYDRFEFYTKSIKVLNVNLSRDDLLLRETEFARLKEIIKKFKNYIEFLEFEIQEEAEGYEALEEELTGLSELYKELDAQSGKHKRWLLARTPVQALVKIGDRDRPKTRKPADDMREDYHPPEAGVAEAHDHERARKVGEMTHSLRISRSRGSEVVSTSGRKVIQFISGSGDQSR